MDCIRLPLEGAKNVRDLGGYCTHEKKTTKFHVFIRGNRLANLTQNDNEFLKEYGITDIIDLRGNTSIQDVFVTDDNYNKKYFNHYHIAISNLDMEKYIQEKELKKEFDFGEGYYLLLKNKHKIKKVFEILANAEGGVLFHCTAGKDRTGTIAALLLGLCQVDDLDIITNYEVTYTYIKDDEYMQRFDDSMNRSNANYMRTLIRHIKEDYGTYENCLIKCGVTQDEIKKIKDKFLI